MNKTKLKSNFLLLMTAMIWGFAFVAQRVGADHVGAMTFNGVRFALGALSLVPVVVEPPSIHMPESCHSHIPDHLQ